jgi:hypothetical protein
VDSAPYKTHPLWTEAMALTREAYALAGQMAAEDPEASKRLRRVAVSVPARVAQALSARDGRRRRDSVAGSRGALVELSLQAARRPGDAGTELARRARDLERAVLFELGSPEEVP